MSDQTTVEKVKSILVDELMLDLEPDEIDENSNIFGPEGLGLDSVDALQLVVALEKHCQLKLPDAEAAKEVLTNVARIAQEIDKGQTA